MVALNSLVATDFVGSVRGDVFEKRGGRKRAEKCVCTRWAKYGERDVSHTHIYFMCASDQFDDVGITSIGSLVTNKVEVGGPYAPFPTSSIGFVEGARLYRKHKCSMCNDR